VSDRRPAAAPGPARGAVALAAAVIMAAVLVCGCAAIPSSGSPLSTPAPAPQGGGIAQGGVLVGPPQAGWSPAAIVKDFLLATSLPAHNYRMARTYLTPKQSRSWHPGSAVTILSGEPVVTPLSRLNGPAANPEVGVTGRVLATLSTSGQYIRASSGAPAATEEYGLENDGGVYKISSLPSASSGAGSGLLLTSDLFHLVYTPRNLYYYGNGTLVPDPVYVPIQSADLVGTLVNDLRHNPAGWLAGAARTYLPAKARLAGLQVFPGPSGGRTAYVNIALPHGTEADIPNMVAQLVCTLTSSAFSPPLFRAVRVKINGRLWPARGSVQNLASYQGEIPAWHRGIGVYYLTGAGSIRTLRANRSEGLAKGASASEPPLSQVAVSPDGAHLAGIAALGNTVYTGDLGSSAKPGVLRTLLTGSFSALSWDRMNDLWIAGRVSHYQGIPDHYQGILVLPSGQSTVLPVRFPYFPKQPVTGLRVAPDGVRVAMIIGSKANAQVWLGALRRGPTGGFLITRPVPLGGQRPAGVLTGVTSVTWYDENHLLVVAGSGGAATLWEVPVDGDNPTSLGQNADIASVTAAGPDNPYYLGFTTGRLERAAGPLHILQEITAGQAPVYPG
jgi:Lipoprotein LpqB beta-propeller domain